MSGNPVVALAGNPNSGKTTLFNRLTGLRQKVGNYPGVTVERKIGTFRSGGFSLDLVDLPGTYSLSPRTEDERVAAEAVAGRREGLPPLRGVVCVVDATNLERSLGLVLQVLGTGEPVVVALNMIDELRLRGGDVDANELSKRLGVPVFPISAHTGEGFVPLMKQLEKWSNAPGSIPERGERVLKEASGEETNARMKEAAKIAAACIRKKCGAHPWSDKVDQAVLHPVAGPLIFGLVVLLVFQSIFTWAAPLMDGMESLVGTLGAFVGGLLPEGLLRSLVVDGIFAGVGGVVVFLPQILILFLFIGFLEHTGYMARAAFVMDRLMSRIGLQGRSFLPLLSCYACAIPGIMATRTIENKRDRLATLFVAPFMTCSARLPVYVLLISAFVPDRPVLGGFLGLPALTMIGLYFLGFLGAVVTAAVLKGTVLKGKGSAFLMEMPPYRLPTAKTVLMLMWDRARLFLRRAGTIILAASILLWFLLTFPRPEAEADLKASYAGSIGTFVEPVLKPLGFDWKIGIGLVSAQAAREVIVATLAQVYQAGDEENTEPLRNVLKEHYSPLVAMSLLVWFVYAMQCFATVAVVRRETGGWPWAAGQFLYMTTVAYLASLAVYQGGLLLGWG